MKYSINVNAVNNQESSVKAFATLTFGDSFKITNIAVLENGEGKVFVSMPRFKSNERTERNEAVYKDICNPITKEFRQELYDNILELYEEMDELGKNEVSKEAEGVEEPEFTVKVSPYEREGSNILGLARIYFEDSFVIGNVSILKGKENDFVAMPSHKTGKKDKHDKPIYQDVCYPVTKEFREKLYGEILGCYQQEKEMAMEKGHEQALNGQHRTQPNKELPFR